MNKVVNVQRLGKDLIVIIPDEICQQLNIKEGLETNMEPFTCAGEVGIRMKIKSRSE